MQKEIHIRDADGEVIDTVPCEDYRTGVRELAEQLGGHHWQTRTGTPNSYQIAYNAEFPGGSWCRETDVFYH